MILEQGYKGREVLKKLEFPWKAEMRQKYFTTRRLEAFTWDALVMRTISLNCYCQ